MALDQSSQASRTVTWKLARWSPMFLMGACIALSFLLAARPLGIDRDYVEYELQYLNGDGASRITMSGFGFLWRACNALDMSFYSALAVTTFLALTPKLVMFTAGASPRFQVVAYSLLFLHTLELTQIRLALALGLALPALHIAMRSGKPSAGALLSAGIAAWIHPSTLIFALPIALWKPMKRYPWIFGSASALLILAPDSLYQELVLRLHPQGDALVGRSDNLPFNPAAVRVVVVGVITAIAWAELRRLPESARPLPVIALYCLCLSIRLGSWPVVAGRVFELGMLLPILWIPLLPRRPREVSCAGYIMLGALISILVALDPTFFQGSR
jgi:hypothetical protein